MPHATPKTPPTAIDVVLDWRPRFWNLLVAACAIRQRDRVRAQARESDALIIELEQRLREEIAHRLALENAIRAADAEYVTSTIAAKGLRYVYA